jgi:hypothetical protein
MSETNELLTARGTISKVRLNPSRFVQTEQKDTVVEVKDDEDEEHKMWTSCCIRVNGEMIQYVGQLVVTMSVIAISTMMLIKAENDCSVSSPYIGLLSFILGKILNNVTNSKKG